MEKGLDIVFLKPKRFEDCDLCVSYIADENIVHINLKNLNDRDARRVYDYVSGAVYVKEARVVDIEDGMICCIPKNKISRVEYDIVNPHRNNQEEEIIPSYTKKK